MPTKLQKLHPDSRQANSRTHAIWFDQHRDANYVNERGERIFEFGRPWWSVIEKASMMPSGPVYPMGWDAPWLPPQSYINDSIGRIPKFESNGFMPRGINSDRFSIAYARMIQDDTDQTRSHYQYAVQVATQKNLPIPEWGKPMDHRVLALVGIQPRSPKIAEAALAGNKWLLGQLMPTRDPVTGQMRVEEDEMLARLLRMGNDFLMTAEQAERKAEAQEAVSGEIKDLFAEVMEMKRQLQAEREALEAEKAAKPKRGRPPKVASEV